MHRPPRSFGCVSQIRRRLRRRLTQVDDGPAPDWPAEPDEKRAEELPARVASSVHQSIPPFGLGDEFGGALLGQESDFVIGVLHSTLRFLPSLDSKGTQHGPSGIGLPRLASPEAQRKRPSRTIPRGTGTSREHLKGGMNVS